MSVGWRTGKGGLARKPSGLHAEVVERRPSNKQTEDQQLAREVARWVMDMPDREEAIARLRRQILKNNYAPRACEIAEAIIAEGNEGHK